MDTSPRSLQIRLKAGVSDSGLRGAHNATLSVPSTVGRKALTKLLQALLNLSDPISFHYILFEEPLRTTLDKFLSRRNLSFEQTVEVTYYLPLPEPRKHTPQPASKEWISSIHALSQVNVLAGSYSGAPIVPFGEAPLLEASSIGNSHKSGIKAVRWLDNGEHFVTASLDRTMRIWKREGGTAETVATFESEQTEHPTIFQSLDVNNEYIAAGAEDGSIWLFPSEPPRAETAKRPRTQSLSGTRMAAVSSLPISSVCWEENNLVSSGWDALARVWDVNRMSESVAIPCGGKPVTSLSVGSTYIISSVDGAVRLVDKRNGKGVVGACSKLGAHKGVVSSVKWVREGVAVSCGFDSTMRFWDVRNMLSPSHIVKVGEGRCLALDTSLDGDSYMIFVAGEDGQVSRVSI